MAYLNPINVLVPPKQQDSSSRYGAADVAAMQNWPADRKKLSFLTVGWSRLSAQFDNSNDDFIVNP